MNKSSNPNLNSLKVMKRTLKAFAAVIACALLGSCVTISRPVAATGNPVGSKCGVAKSTIILGLWSSKGDENGIDKAAKSCWYHQDFSRRLLHQELCARYCPEADHQGLR